jgi:predicted RecA/RadA family phage recombinase
MADTTLRDDGDGIAKMRYTAGSAVAAGEVVLIAATGTTCGIAPLPIPAGATGTLNIGGIYDCVNLDNAANGAKVYWVAASKKVSTTASGNSLFGYILDGGGGGANSTCRVLHRPFA